MLGLHKIQFMDLNGNVSDTPLTPIIPVVKINISKPANMPVEQYALIDTGATLSVIDTTLADLLNLKVVDSTNIRGVTGTIPTTIREAAIHIGASATLFTRLTASPLIQNSKESTYTIILGMDILSTGSVHLNFKDNIFSIDLRSK